jgi:hypothetical protein
MKTYHEACRHVLAETSNSKSATPKTDAMKLAAQRYPELYKAYCRGQRLLSNGDSDGQWTTEAIFMTPEKHARRLAIKANNGRLF